MKKSKILYYALIIGFAILYFITALISFCHAIEFFEIGNVRWMSIALAAVFEIGQMTVLFSILLTNNKKTIIPWILLVILTSIQAIGNVFSVYKYISLSSTDLYVYLQRPLIDWWLSGVEQETIVVIISWIIGALLPIIALFMTSMVSNNIKFVSDDKQEDKKEQESVPEVNTSILSEEKPKDEEVIKEDKKVKEEQNAPKRQRGSIDSLLYGM